MKCFKNVKAYIEGEGIIQTDITFDEKIRAVGKSDGEEIKLPESAVVVPGFIDIHIHGAGGCDAMDGTAQALDTISETLAAEGTAGFLATTVTYLYGHYPKGDKLSDLGTKNKKASPNFAFFGRLW